MRWNVSASDAILRALEDMRKEVGLFGVWREGIGGNLKEQKQSF
jgi:hypothetical protein